MKKFLIFAGDHYYLNGGWDDFEGSEDTIEDCLSRILEIECDWWHIVDSSTQSIIKRESDATGWKIRTMDRKKKKSISE